MQLTCPNCGMRHAISIDSWPCQETGDGEVLLRPRKVRCGVCQEIWSGVPEYASEEPELPAENTPDAADSDDGEAFGARPPRRGWIFVLLALLLLLGGAAFALVAVATGRVDPVSYGLPPLREEVAAEVRGVMAGRMPMGLTMPAVSIPTIRLPEISLPRIELRLPGPPPPPLTVSGDAVRRTLSSGDSLWEISATVRNPMETIQALPAISISLLDREGRVLDRWTETIEGQPLAPGKAHRFETTRLNPPAGATRLKLDLTAPSLARR